MGAFIIDALPADPDAAGNFEVIDGQQRITTFFLLMAASVRTLLINDHIAQGSSYALDYLFTREGISDLRSSLIPSIPDQGDLNAVIDDLWAVGLSEGLQTYSVKSFPQPKQLAGTSRRTTTTCGDTPNDCSTPKESRASRGSSMPRSRA